MASEAGTEIFATADDTLAVGDAVVIFVRPEAIALSRDEAASDAMANRMDGEVVSVLFNGAASRVLVRGAPGGGEIDVALPQTGELGDIAAGQKVSLAWSADHSKCFKAD